MRWVTVSLVPDEGEELRLAAKCVERRLLLLKNQKTRKAYAAGMGIRAP
jgi:hypothetical protein